MFYGRNDAKAETPVLWPLHAKSWLIGKDPDAGRDWGQEEKGATEDEMAGWHHQLDGREFAWTLGDGDGQGGLACCNSGVTKSRTRLRDWSELNRTIWYWSNTLSDMWALHSNCTVLFTLSQINNADSLLHNLVYAVILQMLDVHGKTQILDETFLLFPSHSDFPLDLEPFFSARRLLVFWSWWLLCGRLSCALQKG